MIEVLNKKRKRIGFIEEKKFFNKKHKLIGFLEENIVKDKNGNTILKLDRHDDIFFDNEQVGYLLDSKIYFREDPIFEISKEKKQIISNKGNEVIKLKENDQSIEDLDYFGTTAIFFKSKWLEKVTSARI